MIGGDVDFMVSSVDFDRITKQLKQANVEYRINVENVQS